MTSIETNLKSLAQLQKRKTKVEKSLATVTVDITKQQEVINKQVSKCGVDTNFS